LPVLNRRACEVDLSVRQKTNCSGHRHVLGDGKVTLPRCCPSPPFVIAAVCHYVELCIVAPMHRTELCTVVDAGPYAKGMGTVTGSHSLQRLKELHQSVGRAIAAHFCVGGLESSQGFVFHCQVSLDVSVRRGRTSNCRLHGNLLKLETPLRNASKTMSSSTAGNFTIIQQTHSSRTLRIYALCIVLSCA
jgi:hypothetical protein